MNNERLDGTVYVISGGASGMGAAIAKDFAKRGAKIAVFDLDETRGNQVVENINKEGGCASFYKTDVTCKEMIAKNASQVVETYGKITSWINSAGISKMAPFLTSSEEIYDLMMDVNLKGTFFACQVAIEEMLKTGGGTIINFSSLSGKKASAWQTIYCATKFGTQGLTQAIAKEFADQNIRVNGICPGIVETEMWDKLKEDYSKKRGITPDEVMPHFKKNIPMHRLVDLQDVINAALFLSTDNSSYLTGQSINLVGGEWMD